MSLSQSWKGIIEEIHSTDRNPENNPLNGVWGSILMNASIRGSFVLSGEQRMLEILYLGRLNEKVRYIPLSLSAICFGD